MNGKCIIIPKHFATDEANEFRKNIIYLINNGEKNFNVDFNKCIFIDVTGLGVLISIHKKCIRLNGSLKLLGVNNPNIIRIFKSTRLDNIFEIGE